MKSETNNVLNHYKSRGVVEDCCEYGNGHINDTYLVTFEDDSKIILQKINKFIFKEPKKLMENISAVTAFLKDKIIKNGRNPKRETLNIVRTDEDKIYYEDSKGYIWRAYEFVSDAICYEKADCIEEFYESGRAFGNFQNLLSDFPVAKLNEIIKDFHNTEVRFNTFQTQINEDISGRAKTVKKEIDFFIQREKYTHIFNNALNSQDIPLKVTHNDTKLNNILFDKNTKKALCVIDLDTVMPGVAAFDFGDAIRFGANTALEDETDLSKVSLDMDLYEAFTKGFLQACGNSMKKKEIELLHLAAVVMTYECGIRFLGDYIAGDRYFKISREHQNLDRARTQIKLVIDMEDKLENMKQIVRKYI